MKLAIMQPYFLPYAGYFQLLAAADTFVVYDEIKYTKKGWINRNRRLQDGADVVFSLPLKKGSDSLDVVERELAADFDPAKLLGQFRASYAAAPQFAQVWPLLERILHYEDRNLFRYVHHSIAEVAAYLGLETPLRTSSTVEVEPGLKAQDRVIALCRAMGADTYINPPGGTDLYDREEFLRHGIALRFLQPEPFEYAQYGDPFVPWLSIVDVLMFNSLPAVRDYVQSGYELT